jgi:anthranilate synthase/aminodeoxychorismate synthase-like glutamine amidotransferase
MLVIIDNYDSFTYNLVQYLGELGVESQVVRNDTATPEDVLARGPKAIVVSAGPGAPAAAGISVEIVRLAAGRVPVLGVCLGHQAIAEAFGGRVVRAERLLHGKTSAVAHEGEGLFAGLPSPFEAMRYHSLVVDPASVPAALRVTAWADDRPPQSEIMGLRHQLHPIFGVQFHPESIGTPQGRRLLGNFLELGNLRD